VVLMIPVALVLAALLAVGVGRVGSVVLQRQRAQIAADAAALAGVRGGRSAAVSLAEANGATLVGFERVDDDVVVTVQVGVAEAAARATDGP
jgi:hypothetical protein